MKSPEIIRAAIEIGHGNSFITFDQLNALLPTSATGPEEIRSTHAGIERRRNRYPRGPSA